MDLDSKTYSKLISAYNSYGGSVAYISILGVVRFLTKRHSHKTPKMWCSRIRDSFRKILKET